MEKAVHVVVGRALGGVTSNPFEQLIGVRQMPDTIPDLRHRQHEGFAQCRVLVDVVVVLAEHAKLPRHHQAPVVLDPGRAFHARPLFQEHGAVFQRLENTETEYHVGAGPLPAPGQQPAGTLASGEDVLRVILIEIDGELKLGGAKQVRRHTIEMAVHHIDKRLAAVLPSGIGNHRQRPIIGGTTALTDPANLDQFLAALQNASVVGGKGWHLRSSLFGADSRVAGFRVPGGRT